MKIQHLIYFQFGSYIALESRHLHVFWTWNIFVALLVLAIGDVTDDNHGNANTAVGRAMY